MTWKRVTHKYTFPPTQPSMLHCLPCIHLTFILITGSRAHHAVFCLVQLPQPIRCSGLTDVLPVMCSGCYESKQTKGKGAGSSSPPKGLWNLLFYFQLPLSGGKEHWIEKAFCRLWERMLTEGTKACPPSAHLIDWPAWIDVPELVQHNSSVDLCTVLGLCTHKTS